MKSQLRDPVQMIEQLAALLRTVRSAAHQAYAGHGVGSSQGRFIRHLGKSGVLNQAELARATDTDPALTGRTLTGLIERGWVKRTRSTEDRRQYLLELTASGQKVRAKLDDARAGLGERVLEKLDAKDLADFERVAAKIFSALEGA